MTSWDSEDRETPREDVMLKEIFKSIELVPKNINNFLPSICIKYRYTEFTFLITEALCASFKQWGPNIFPPRQLYIHQVVQHSLMIGDISTLHCCWLLLWSFCCLFFRDAASTRLNNVPLPRSLIEEDCPQPPHTNKPRNTYMDEWINGRVNE